jgi:WD40 repeat protein
VAQRGLIALGAYDLGGIAFYADSTSMVISQSGRAVLWDTTVSGGGTNPLANTPAYFAFSPTDASIFAILDANGRAYNLSLGEDAATRETDLFSVPNYTLDADVYGIAWSDERQLFALRTANTLDVWDGLTGQQVTSLSAGNQIVDAVVMEDASGIFYTGDDEIVYYWNAATNASQLVASFSAPVHRLALWQSTLAMVYEEAGSLAVDVRDISTGIRLYYGRLDAGIEVTSIAVTNTVLAIAVNSANGSAVGLWGIGSEAQVWLPDQIQPVNQMRFSPDGTILAIGSLDNAIRLWGIAAP